MFKTFSILFYLQRNKATKDGKAPIYLRSTVNGRRSQISIKRKISINKWNNEAGKVIGTTLEVKELNRYLNSLEHRVFKIQQKLMDDNPAILNSNANTWQGVFPTKKESIDGFKFIAPVKSYPANSIGIYDMAGNVWELTADLFNVNHYKELEASKAIINPTGTKKSYSPANPNQVEHVMKGGSFLCHESYCASFRISSKRGVAIDSGSDHMGFRTIATIDMISN